MAGHSHSANIKYRKERVNAAKAKAFSKVARMITVAAKLGGGDPDANPRLRLAIDKARMVSMPKDNIERAIKKGTGGADDRQYEELLYEGYAAAGVAVMLEILTDNRNRTASEIRRIFERAGGNLGSSGSVAWMFERKAVLRVDKAEDVAEERLLELAIDAGADDLLDVGESFEVRCEPAESDAVRTALTAAGVEIAGAEIGFLPKSTALVDDVDEARKVTRCLDALDEHEDVQSSYANFDFSDEVLERLAADG